ALEPALQRFCLCGCGSGLSSRSGGLSLVTIPSRMCGSGGLRRFDDLGLLHLPAEMSLPIGQLLDPPNECVSRRGGLVVGDFIDRRRHSQRRWLTCRPNAAQFSRLASHFKPSIAVRPRLGSSLPAITWLQRSDIASTLASA